MTRDIEKRRRYNRENYYRNKQTYVERSKIWKANNPDKVKATRRNYKLRHPKSEAEWQKKRQIEVYNSLSNKCALCGYNILVALQIDHINPADKKSKRDWMNKKYDLNKLQLLCENCHAIKTYSENKYVR